MKHKLLIIDKKFSHFPKITDDTINQTQILTRIQNTLIASHKVSEAGSFRSRAKIWCNKSEFLSRFPSNIEYPALEWREYRDVRVDPREVLTGSHTLLPETFRLFRKKYLNNTQVVNAGPYYGREPAGTPQQKLPGTYYYLDNEFLDIFGHTTTEVISRTWAFEQSKERFPDLKILMSVTPGKSLKPWIAPYLEACGIPSTDVVLFDKPTLVDRLIGMTPQFSNYGYAHPTLKQHWERVRNTLAGEPVQGLKEKKIFVSRADTSLRGCHNSADLESTFANSGFEVVYPEKLTLPEQARLFGSASAVAGYAGSGTINTFMCQPNVPKLLIAPETYFPTNEALIASVLGGELSYFYCDPDHNHPANSWSAQAHHSSFTFDFFRDGPQLEAWLHKHR